MTVVGDAPATDATDTRHNSAGTAALAVAGEAAAFIAGAPIAGVNDAATELGDVAAGHEASGVATKSRGNWLWAVLGALVIAALIWLLLASR